MRHTEANRKNGQESETLIEKNKPTEKNAFTLCKKKSKQMIKR
jgi:hypothetical protein